MSSFANQYLGRKLIITPHLLNQISALSVFKGKPALFEQQSPEVL